MSVVVTFVGICTHIPRVPIDAPVDALSPEMPRSTYNHRVVMPHASLGYRWNNQGISPHDAVLYIPKAFVKEAPMDLPGLELIDAEAMTWRMQSVEMYVQQASIEPLYTESYNKVPKLTDCAHVLSLQLDPRVVTNGCASAVFDVFGGVIDAYLNPLAGKAVQVTVSVDTANDVRALHIFRMWDRADAIISLQEAELEGRLYQPQVFVLNTGRSEGDQDIDFFLHYLSTTWTPPNDQVPPQPGDTGGIRPPTPEELALLSNLPDGVTFGCSNSNYP